MSDFANKQRIQYLLFPEGIYVNKETQDYRTPRINSVFLYFARLKRVLGKKESGKTGCIVNFPASVEATGIEPVSKHIPQKLSTCLFCFGLSGINWKPSFAEAAEDKTNNRFIP